MPSRNALVTRYAAIRAAGPKYDVAPRHAVAAAPMASTSPVWRRRADRFIWPAPTHATAVAAKYVTRRSVAVLAPYAIDSSSITQTNAQHHGATVTPRTRNRRRCA